MAVRGVKILDFSGMKYTPLAGLVLALAAALVIAFPASAQSVPYASNYAS